MRLLEAAGYAFLTVLGVAALTGIAVLMGKFLDELPAWVSILISFIFTFLLAITIFYYAL